MTSFPLYKDMSGLRPDFGSPGTVLVENFVYACGPSRVTKQPTNNINVVFCEQFIDYIDLRMPSVFSSVAVLGFAASALAADVPVPQGMRGKYKGNVYQQYGTADPKNPQSYECITDASAKQGTMAVSRSERLQLPPNCVLFGTRNPSPVPMRKRTQALV